MSGRINLDTNYLRSIPGILKVCCLLCSFSGFLCIIVGAFTVDLRNFRGLFYILVATLSLISTSIVLLARLLQWWKYKFYPHEVVKYEMYLTTGFSIIFYIAAAVVLTLDVIAYSMASFFGFLAAIFYAYEAYLCYRKSRQRDATTQT